LSAVRIHTGEHADRSAESMNAAAYAVGNNIVFAKGEYSPQTSGGRRLIAHELAHLGQQSLGSTAGTIQRFTRFGKKKQQAGHSLGWQHPAGDPLRVSDDGFLASEDNGWGEGLSTRAWSTPAKVAESNRILTGQASRVQLQLKGGGQGISGKAPETKQDMALEEVEPISSAGGPLTLAQDCGGACRQVMGTNPGKKDVAVVGGGTTKPSGTIGGVVGGIGGLLAGGAAGAALGSLLGSTGAIVGGILGGIGGLIGGAIGGSAIEKKLRGEKTVPKQRLTPRTYHGGDPTTPEEWSEELYKKEFGAGLSREEAYRAYANLSDSDRDNFDRKYQINKYAVPKVGQGITISTEKDMPGYAESSGFTWNFHYAAPVLTSGHDYITVENAAGWAPTGWILFMYGPESKGQSFYEYQGDTNTHGTKHSAYVVEPE
jgi:hypothetical protein